MSGDYIAFMARVDALGTVVQYGLVELTDTGIEKALNSASFDVAFEFVDASAFSKDLIDLDELNLTIPFYLAQDKDEIIYMPDYTAKLTCAYGLLLMMPVLQLNSSGYYESKSCLKDVDTYAKDISFCSRLWDICVRHAGAYSALDSDDTQFIHWGDNVEGLLAQYNYNYTDCSKMVIPEGTRYVAQMALPHSDDNLIDRAAMYIPRSVINPFLLCNLSPIKHISAYWTKLAGVGSCICDGVLPYFARMDDTAFIGSLLLGQKLCRVNELELHLDLRGMRYCSRTLSAITGGTVDLADSEFGYGFDGENEMLGFMSKCDLSEVKLCPSFGRRKSLLGAFRASSIDYLDLRAVEFRSDVILWSSKGSVESIFDGLKSNRIDFNLASLENVAQIKNYPDELWRIFTGLFPCRNGENVEIVLDNCSGREYLVDAFKQAVAFPVWANTMHLTIT